MKNDEKVKADTSKLQLHYPSSPSLLRTHSRRQQFTANEVSPLLANLSPASTWEALVATSAVAAAKDDNRKFVETSVAHASESERAWGIRAALAGKKIHEWYDELSSWPWQSKEAASENPFETMANDDRVDRYMDRIETIKDDMETLRVDELKNHVRETHVIQGSGIPNYKKLEDFAAIITATIVQSLPTLSYLSALLKAWSVRLIILKEIPSLLMELGSCRESMISAWLAIGQGVSNGNGDGPRRDFTQRSFISVKAVLQDQLSELARKIDSQLDLLEGSRDTLPNKWIDGMDDLETEYSSWVVAAQDLVFTNEMGSSQSHNISRTVDKPPLPSGLTGREETSNEIENDSPLARSMSEPGADGILPLDLKPPSSDVKDLAGTLTMDGPGEDMSSLETRKEEHSSEKKEKPAALSIPTSLLNGIASHPDLSSSHSPGSDSEASEDFSNKSSPEIMSASVATFFGSPVEVMTPRVSARNSISSNTSRSVHRKSEPIDFKLSKSPERAILRTGLRPQQRSVTSPPDSPPPQLPQTFAADDRAANLPLGQPRVRSASMQSFEKIGNQDIRKLLVRRTGSYSPCTPAMPPPVNKVAADLPSLLPDNSLKSNDAAVETVNPTTSEMTHRSLKSTDNATTIESPKHQRTPSSTAKRFHKELSSPPKALQHNPASSVLSSTKTRNRFEEFSDAPAGTMSIKVQKLRSANPSAQNPIPSAGVAKPKDQLEARISRILTNIPADIRLKSTGSKTPPSPSNRPRNISDPRTPLRRSITPKLLRAKTPTQSPSLTLEAAPKSDGKPAQHVANDSEIRIYHLQQSGKDTAPLKLHVRLVGEAGERVMVRVGGGWADLGEYLRDYAMHHSSSSKRSVSDNNPYFDFQSLPGSSPAVSTPGGLSTPASRSRPVSPMTSSRPSSRSSWTEMTGNESPSLMGLKAERLRKADISPGKQAWVEGMVDQARQGGSNANGNGNLKKEKRKSSVSGSREEGMGWLGKVGGTNRVFLRGKRDVSGP
ncbi:MAG: hypothetical protein OHK93_003669 [Ramalina farinacea]|uniref:GAR domain-containing protein n=1 Tax=Ramalina farinacea TaxID=258253 RepID=A0AA43QY60_9LECA|nr:hypothetical protein [Ramalina farinacea]